MTTWNSCRHAVEAPGLAACAAADARHTGILAAASHDLRQPVQALKLHLDGLSTIDLPERSRQAVLDAQACAQDLSDMFGAVLDLARLDAGQDTPRPESFCLNDLLSRVERTFSPIAHASGARLKIRRCGHLVFSDPLMVERILHNLVGNAVRHAPGGRVLVACRRQGALLRLAVFDTGAGIAPAQQQAIFQDFYQIKGTRHASHSAGLGLGLAIVRRLALSLDAPVCVRSQPGRGSVFLVELPHAKARPHSLTGTKEY